METIQTNTSGVASPNYKSHYQHNVIKSPTMQLAEYLEQHIRSCYTMLNDRDHQAVLNRRGIAPNFSCYVDILDATFTWEEMWAYQWQLGDNSPHYSCEVREVSVDLREMQRGCARVFVVSDVTGRPDKLQREAASVTEYLYDEQCGQWLSSRHTCMRGATDVFRRFWN